MTDPLTKLKAALAGHPAPTGGIATKSSPPAEAGAGGNFRPLTDVVTGEVVFAPREAVLTAADLTAKGVSISVGYSRRF